MLKRLLDSIKRGVRNGTKYTISILERIAETAREKLPSYLGIFTSGIVIGITDFVRAAPELVILYFATVGVSFAIGEAAFVVMLPKFVESKLLPWISGTVVIAVAKTADLTHDVRYN